MTGQIDETIKSRTSPPMIGKDKEYKERGASSFDRVESIPQEKRNLEELSLSTRPPFVRSGSRGKASADV